MRDIKECISSFSTIIENAPLNEKSTVDTPVKEIIENKILSVNTSLTEKFKSTGVNQPSSDNENDFCEITDLEIKSVRNANLKETNAGNNKARIKQEANNLGNQTKQQNISQEKTSDYNTKDKFDCKGTTFINDQIATSCDSKVNGGKTVCDTVFSKSPNESYANIAGKIPEPVCLQEQPCGKDIILTSNEQQLAKILTKDKKYPKEKAPNSVNNIRNPI